MPQWKPDNRNRGVVCHFLIQDVTNGGDWWNVICSVTENTAYALLLNIAGYNVNTYTLVYRLVRGSTNNNWLISHHMLYTGEDIHTNIPNILIIFDKIINAKSNVIRIKKYSLTQYISPAFVDLSQYVIGRYFLICFFVSLCFWRNRVKYIKSKFLYKNIAISQYGQILIFHYITTSHCPTGMRTSQCTTALHHTGLLRIWTHYLYQIWKR